MPREFSAGSLAARARPASTNAKPLMPCSRATQRRFSRIQSTACEQQQFEALVMGLDSELLMALAVGRTCLVWDCAIRAQGRHGASRAVWCVAPRLAFSADNACV